jgi:PAS domain S-box-containing protein
MPLVSRYCVPVNDRLAETIAILEATLDATHAAILVVDMHRRVVRYNRPFLAAVGISAETIQREGLDGIITALVPQLEDPETELARSAEIWKHPERETADFLRFKDGRVIERFVKPCRIDSRIVALAATYRDVSQKARTEQALEQHRAFLEKAQEVGHIGSWVADADGKIGWSNEAHRIFGVPIGEFGGTPAEFFERVHPDDREMVRAAAQTAPDWTATYSIDHRIVRPDGTIRWVHAQADLIRDAAGKPIRIIGTIQDITERRQLEEQLRQAQKMEAIGRLAGGIAHDLNNALTAIAGYAELALGDIELVHPARPDIEEIKRAAARAASVTRQLLAFSRHKIVEPRIFELNDTVHAIVRLVTRLLGPDIDVLSNTGRSLPPILGDPGQVEQAIVNLAVNARDAMPNGGRLTLETLVMEVDEAYARAHVPMAPGRYAVLRVSDTGHGMAAETKARIFEPFFTTKEIGKGTGLGLSMVYGTLKQIGGFIFVDSEPGAGTKFSLFFPPAPHAADSARAEPAGASSRGHAAPGNAGPTLLIVEDEDAVRNLVASALRNEEYELLLAGSADEALDIVAKREGAIDLLLTDAVMPGRSGVDLARELTERKPGLPVILMSGYTEETLPMGGVEPAITLLPKPFTPRELRQRIREKLGRALRAQ